MPRPGAPSWGTTPICLTLDQLIASMLHTKFQLYRPSGSGEEVEKCKKSNGRTDRQTDGWRTTRHGISSPGKEIME